MNVPIVLSRDEWLLQEVKIKLEKDRVAQEFDETFSIHAEFSNDPEFFSSNTTFFQTINVTIIDADGKLSFGLSGSEYTTTNGAYRLWLLLLIYCRYHGEGRHA